MGTNSNGSKRLPMARYSNNNDMASMNTCPKLICASPEPSQIRVRSSKRLTQHHQFVADRDSITLSHPHARNHTRRRCDDFGLHLHRLKHQQQLPLLHGVTLSLIHI